MEKLRIIPLGGVMEIGKNMTAYVCDERILVVDAGLMFPDDEMFGVDIVIPDITFLEENAEKVLGIVLTHGHEDHIGALPYVLRRLDVPVWATRLTLRLVQSKLVEHHLDEVVRLHEVDPDVPIDLGPFHLEFIPNWHSIPDSFGLCIRTDAANVVVSGDFKFEEVPICGAGPGIDKLGAIGSEGVDLLMCDSTNAEKPGFTPSAHRVTESFRRIFASAQGRVLVAAFASNIDRIQRVYDVAAEFGRRVVVVGRSMEENCRIAEELGYLRVSEENRLQLSELDSVKPEETVIVTTGSQGEPLSALSRMATDEHKRIKIQPGDTVIISATPVPGNEDLVMRTINHLFKRGAEVFYEPYARVHVSGHGCQEDIKRMLGIVRPRFVVPVHGEHRHYAWFVKVAAEVGYDRDSVIGMQPGDVLELSKGSAKIVDRVPAGSVMVDGMGVGDVEDLVLRDRGHLAHHGVVVVVVGIDIGARSVVSGPDILSKGFVGEDREPELASEGRDAVLAKLNEYIETDMLEELDDIKAGIRKTLAKLFYERTRRRPMIVPVVMEV